MNKKPTIDQMRLALTKGKTKHEHAHEQARLNAIKMLGLHEKNTAQDRAKAMGFDLETFHGTDAPNIESLDPERTKIIKGVFSTTHPRTASRYAEDERKRAKEQSAPNVLPLLIKSASHELIPKYDINTINDYRNRGAKGVYRPEMQTAVTFDPSHIRSRFAAFDPSRQHESDLLASKGGEVLPHHQREANKAKFLEPSKIKDVLYRGQRRSPKADKFITTQDRATPSFTTDPEVANVYSRQLGWDIEHGPGSTSVPVHMQTEKPFDMRKHGEHASLDEFIDQMDHDLTVPTHHKKLGYEDLADILYTLDNSVFKGGAKHVINARDSKGYKIRGFDKLGDEVMSAGKKKDIDRILHELLPDASVDAYALADNPDFVKNLKKQGYDSIIHKDVFDAGMPYYQGDKDKIEEGYDANHVIDAYRPLHQNKIKSAIGNRGTYDTTNPDITKAKGGSVMGINVASDRKAGRSYADMIVDGHKTLESRNSDTLRPYVGKRVAIVRTGEGKAKAIGEVTIGEPIVANKKQFRNMESHHLVPEGSTFDIKTPTKHMYPLSEPVRYEQVRDVGHGIVSRKVIEKAKGGKVKGPQPLLPKETVKAYKLFRVDQKQPGKLFPLFVDANTPVEKDKWVEAKVGEMTGNKVKSKIGPLAYRPGWHAGDLPVATHIGEKSDNSLTAPDRRPKNQVWAEVEMPNDVDWQSEANRRGTNKQGKLIPVKAHITDQIPLGGHYRYKTNSNMTGNWLIGGAMKVNRVLPDEEVQKINKKAKVSDLPRSEPINLKDYGFRSGGNVQPLLPKFKE